MYGTWDGLKLERAGNKATNHMEYSHDNIFIQNNNPNNVDTQPSNVALSTHGASGK